MDRIRKRNLAVGIICLGIAVIGYAHLGRSFLFYMIGLLAMVFAILFLLMARNKQSRFMADVATKKTPEEVCKIVENILVKDMKFKLKDYKGTIVYQKGDGFWTQRECVQVELVQSGEVHIEAWLSAIWQGENNFTGYLGMVPKRHLKKQVEQLIVAIQ